MAINRGKDFEKTIRECFEAVPNTSVDRLHDQTNGFAGSVNVCDFIVYHRPFIYYLECKSVHGNTLPFSNITKNQWHGLLEKSKIDGVIAGVVCWWIDKDVTVFIPIQLLDVWKLSDMKSIRYDDAIKCPSIIELTGKKKRVFFDYDMEQFFNVSRIWYEMKHPTEIPKRSDIWQK